MSYEQNITEMLKNFWYNIIMNKANFKRFVNYLIKNNQVIAPQKTTDGRLILGPILKFEALVWESQLPLDSWKWYAFPPLQKMFDYQGNQLKTVLPAGKSQILLGVSVLDLQALTLLNQIFEKDVYYQEIKKKTIVIGTSFVPEENFYEFFDKFEEDKLEHLQFDIFIAIQKFDYKIYTGTEDGQRLLDKFGYKNYQHIEYAGPIREEGLDPQMVAWKNAMQNPKNREKFSKVWQDLGQRCMQCGKCTIACPVCFCFRIFDQANLAAGQGSRQRCWDSCFYNDFTTTANVAPDLPKHRQFTSTAERIYFWYEHHFVRTPATFSLPGCVGCNRCSRTCPANINIWETLRDVLNS